MCSHVYAGFFLKKVLTLGLTIQAIIPSDITILALLASLGTELKITRGLGLFCQYDNCFINDVF
jgi:hypothetical protein